MPGCWRVGRVERVLEGGEGGEGESCYNVFPPTAMGGAEDKASKF